MNDISLRDYFAAHAPAEPWPEFQPVIEVEIPERPPFTPVGNYGETPDEAEATELRKWQSELSKGKVTLSHSVCFPELPECYSYWLKQWNDYYTFWRQYAEAVCRERRAQWPWFYADEVLKRRTMK